MLRTGDGNTAAGYREDIEKPASLDIYGAGQRCRVAWCRYTFAENESLSTRSHKHSMYELHYVVSGALLFVLPGHGSLSVCAGQYVIIPPEWIHGIENTNEQTVKFVAGFHWPGEELTGGKRLLRQAAVMTASKTMSLLADALLEKERLSRKSATAADIVDALIREAMEGCAVSGGRTAGGIKNTVRTERILQYIHEQTVLDINADHLAEVFGFSLRQLNRITEQTLGKTATQLINDERISRIKQLLKNSNYSLTDIALTTGFADEFSCIRFFKRYTGMPPGRYRKTHSAESRRDEEPI